MSRKAVTTLATVWLFAASLTIPRVSCLPSDHDAGLLRVLIRINDANGNCTEFKQQLERLISATSEQLFATTKTATYWKSVWVALPSGWKKDNCFLPDVVPAAPSWYRYGSADLIIDHSHPLLGDTPWAKQYGGCRVPGKHIRLSFDYVLNSTNQERKLVKEWIKYRYGVFEESGFENDYQYPVTYNDSMITLANNNQSDAGEGDTISSCDDDNNNSTQGSDLCTKQVLYLSNADNHDKMAPTKQNVLCRELSHWQVLEQHPDFQLSSIDEESIAAVTEWTTDTPAGSDTQYEEPTIHYFVPDLPRYVLLLDRSSHMANASRWTLLRRALYRWVHSLPDDTLLSIVVAGREASQVLPWTRVSQENRDGLAGRIPRRPLAQEEFCYSCGIRLATQLLSQSEDRPGRGGNIIVVSGMTGIPDDFESIRTELEASEMRVDSVIFPGQSSVGEDLGVSALKLSVMETWPNEAAVTQARLTQALLQVLREEHRDAPNQIYEKLHYARDGNSVLGSFTLDSGTGRNVWITAHSADEADLDTLEVVSPSGIVYDLPLVYDGLLYIRIGDTNEFGDWSYRLRFSHPVKDHAPAVVEVTAQPSKISELTGNHSSTDTFSVRGWTSIGNTVVNASQTPILLYAEVLRGQTPVIDAKVVAVVRLPGLQSVAEEVVLHDRGTGDPDITRADGIYSAYFTRAVEEPGSYSVTIYVTDNGRRASLPLQNARDSDVTCCGSSMRYVNSAPSGPFQRIAVIPSFSTSAGPAKGQDIYPPSRITDLRIERVFNSSNEVELSWTAPGGDYDSGIASFYEIRCYTDRSALNDSSSAILVHSSLTPPPSLAGSPQHAVVAVPWPNQQFYYAMVAVDEHQNRGDVSNIVTVYIYEPPPPPTTPPPVNETDPADTSSLFGAARSNIDTQRAADDTQMYAIAGGVAGFVVLLLILSVAAFCSRRKGSSVKEKKPQDAKSSVKIQVEPLNVEKLPPKEEVLNLDNIPEKDRPVYQIFVNNAYIQEEDGEVKIITPDGQVIQRGSSSWYSTLPRGRSITNLNETSFNDGLHWSLPRSKASPHRHKVLTNGSIMQTTGGGSQNTLGIPVADGTSISSKPSVSSEDTGIELNDPGNPIEADSRDSGDTAVIPPPGYGPYPVPHHSGYMPMFGNYVPNVHAQNARVVRVASSCNSPDSCGLPETYMQPSSRRPIVGSVASSSNEEGYANGSVQGDFPQTPRKKRHISFV